MKNLFIFIFSSSAVFSPSILTDNNILANSTPTEEITFSFRLIPMHETNEDKIIIQKLVHAQQVASELFEEVEKNNLIVAGKSEDQLNKEVEKLALDKFGIEKHWHKKIVRSGENTLAIYNDNPPDRIIQTDDILFIDFGIVADGW